MVEVIRDLWVCQDCLIFIANGDLTGLDNDPSTADARQAAILAGVERELPYQWVADGPTEDEHEGSCDDAFSWRACACCGTKLGGSRHRCALILVVKASAE